MNIPQHTFDFSFQKGINYEYGLSADMLVVLHAE